MGRGRDDKKMATEDSAVGTACRSSRFDKYGYRRGCRFLRRKKSFCDFGARSTSYSHLEIQVLKDYGARNSSQRAARSNGVSMGAATHVFAVGRLRGFALCFARSGDT